MFVSNIQMALIFRKDGFVITQGTYRSICGLLESSLQVYGQPNSHQIPPSISDDGVFSSLGVGGLTSQTSNELS